MSDSRVQFSHALTGGFDMESEGDLAALISTELNGKNFEILPSGEYSLVFFDVNCDHDLVFSLSSNGEKGLVTGSFGLDPNSSVNKAAISNATWGLILVAIIVGGVMDNFKIGIGVAIGLLVIDYFTSSGDDQKTKSVITDAINRAYHNL